MSTRSRVAIETAGKIKSTYVHFDGYVTGVGGTLLRHYNSHKGAASVAALGCASSLYATLQETVDNTTDHDKDVEAVWSTDLAAYLKTADNTWAEYAYLWTDGRWLVAKINGTGEEAWQELDATHAADMVGEDA